MADVVHSTLTDPDLHEPKGVAAADADQVYVSDGAGSGDWTDISSTLGSDRFTEVAFFRDEKSSSTDGGTFTSGSWQVRTLNTTVNNDITGCSISTNTITLPAGTFLVMASAPAVGVNAHKTRLYNTSDSSAALAGTSEFSTSGGTNQSRSFVNGVFTIGSPKNFQLQHICSTTLSSTGFGKNSGSGANEVYAEIWIWKIA